MAKRVITSINDEMKTIPECRSIIDQNINRMSLIDSDRVFNLAYPNLMAKLSPNNSRRIVELCYGTVYNSILAFTKDKRPMRAKRKRSDLNEDNYDDDELEQAQEDK